MSGGYFNYNQRIILQIADEIEELILNNNSTEKDEFGYGKGRNYKPETIIKFSEAITMLRKAEKMARRIDWLVSDDDGEKSFHCRWEEEIGEIK